MPYSCLPEELRNKLDEYVVAYNKAEKALKFFEVSTSEGLIFPAVNELRCAGQHIARAFKESNVDNSIKSIEHAIRHARRAQYDAYDAFIIYSLDRCKFFREDYKNEPIYEVNFSYTEEKLVVDRLITEIAQEDRTKREDYTDQKEQQLAIVQKIAEKWDASREELNKKTTLRRRSEKIQIWVLIFTAIGLCATVVSWFAFKSLSINNFCSYFPQGNDCRCQVRESQVR